MTLFAGIAGVYPYSPVYWSSEPGLVHPLARTLPTVQEAPIAFYPIVWLTGYFRSFSVIGNIALSSLPFCVVSGLSRDTFETESYVM